MANNVLSTYYVLCSITGLIFLWKFNFFYLIFFFYLNDCHCSSHKCRSSQAALAHRPAQVTVPPVQRPDSVPAAGTCLQSVACPKSGRGQVGGLTSVSSCHFLGVQHPAVRCCDMGSRTQVPSVVGVKHPVPHDVKSGASDCVIGRDFSGWVL